MIIIIMVPLDTSCDVGRYHSSSSSSYRQYRYGENSSLSGNMAVANDDDEKEGETISSCSLIVVLNGVNVVAAEASR